MQSAYSSNVQQPHLIRVDQGDLAADGSDGLHAGVGLEPLDPLSRLLGVQVAIQHPPVGETERRVTLAEGLVKAKKEHT